VILSYALLFSKTVDIDCLNELMETVSSLLQPEESLLLQVFLETESLR
jgi:hypothetical protein